MTRVTLRLICVLVTTLLFNTNVLAHGGVSIEADKCVLRIGKFLMHFTGYQPESSGGEEFCEDIPKTGHAIIVMDFVDAQLRKMNTNFTIVQKDTWDEAMAYQLGDEATEIVNVPYRLYPGGSITFEHSFAEPGYFVGVVESKGMGQGELNSIFPFSVGYGIGTYSGAGGTKNIMLTVFGVVVLAGGLFYFVSSRKKETEVV